MDTYKALPSRSPVEYAFEVLERTSQRRFTQWSIVYDVSRRQVHFRTRENPKIRRIDFTRLDFGCATPVRILDLAGKEEGDVTGPFRRYTAPGPIETLLAAAYAGQEFTRHAGALDTMARHPERSRSAPGQLLAATQ